MKNSFDAPKIARKMLTWEALVILIFIAPVAIYAASTIGKSTNTNLAINAGQPIKIFLTANAGTGVQTWTVPADWNNSNNSIECIGAGGDGSDGQAGSPFTAAGGGGGDYAKITNLSLTPSGTASYMVGAHATTTKGSLANETYFNSTASSTASLSCAFGKKPTGSTAVATSTTADSTGTTKFAGGGSGGSPLSNGGSGGGGGSAGPTGGGQVGGIAVIGHGAGGGGGSNGGSSTSGQVNPIAAASNGGAGGNGTGGTGGGAGGTSGGNGSNGTAGTGAGGGGGGGDTGDGGNGAIDTAFDATHGAGGGGGGGAGFDNPAGAGGTYGGGGGGGGYAAGTGGAGGQGIIVITYTPVNSLVGWWTFDGPDMVSNVADKSGNGNKGFLSGFTSTTTAEGPVGGALAFDGVDDNINASVGALTTVFTFSAWIYPTASNDGNYHLIVEDNNGGTNTGCKLYLTNSGKIAAYSLPVFAATSNTALATNRWYHVVMTNNGSASKVYVNGQQDGSDGVSISCNSSTSVRIGASFDTSAVQFFAGNIDDVRIYNRTLTADEIKRLYGLGATSHIGVSPTTGLAATTSASGASNGLMAWWTFDGKNMLQNVADSSGNGHPGRLISFTSTSTASTEGAVGQGLSFVPAGVAYVDVGSGHLPFLKTTPFSGSMWIKSSLPTILMSNLNLLITGGWYLVRSGKAPAFAMLDSSSFNGFIVTGSTNIMDDKWHLVSFTYDGSGAGSGVKLYVDGVLESMTPSPLGSGNPGTLTDSGFLLGAYKAADFPQIGFSGSMDDARVYNRVLSADEMKKLYGVGATTHVGVSPTTGLAAPLAASGASNGLVGWWTFDGKNMLQNAADSSGSGNAGRLIGFTSTSTAITEGKLGQALSFDGTDDYVSAPSPTVGTSWSMSEWLNSDTNANFTNVSQPLGNSTKTQFQIGMCNSSGPCGAAGNSFYTYAADGENPLQSSAVRMPPGTWHLVTITHANGGNTTIYFDGASIGSAGSTAGNTTSAGIQIGSYDGGQLFFRGKIDDVRIYNRALSATEVQRLYDVGR